MIDFQIPSVSLYRFLGLNDQAGLFGLKQGEFSTFYNAVTRAGAVRRRFGYEPRIATAITGAAKVTGISAFIDSGLNNTFVAVSSGKVYEDVSGSWTERSTGTPFSTSNPTSITQVGRNIVLSDQTNIPRIWNGVSAVDVLHKDLRNANCVGSHKGQLFVGSPTWESTREFASVRWFSRDDPTVFTGKSDLNGTGQPLAIMSTGEEQGGAVIVFMSNAIWKGVYSPGTSGSAGSGFEYSFDPIDDGIGIVGANAAARVPGKRIFFWGHGEGAPPGPYVMGEDPITKPVYIGRRIEAFIAGIDKTQQSIITVFPVPGQKCVLFNVPWGSNQSTNNYAVYYNWEEDSFAIFKGCDAQAFAFSAGASVEQAGPTFKCYAGDYAGMVYEVGTGLRDNGQAIETEIWTGWLGGGGTERKWLSLVLDMELGTTKTLQVRYRLYGKAYEPTDTLTGGSVGDTIGESFTIGVSAIAGENTGRLVGDIYADAAQWIKFGIIDTQDNQDFVLYGLESAYERASGWLKAS